MKKTLKITSVVLALVLLCCSCGNKISDSSFSAGLDDNGMFKGIKATDYVDASIFDSLVVKQEDIDAEIDELVTEWYPAQNHITDRAVSNTDAFNIDYVGTVDGVAFSGGTATNQTVSFSNNTYIDGFLDGCVGHRPGESFDIYVTFPNPYENDTSLSGKEAKFNIKLNYIIEYVPAEFTDEFVVNNMKANYGFTTTKEVEEYFKEMFTEDLLIASVKEVPESVMEWVKAVCILQLKDTAENSYGVELVTLLKAYGCSSEEEYIEKNKASLEEEGKVYLAMQAFAEHDGISLTDEEITKYFEDDNVKISLEDAKEKYGLPYIKQILSFNKVYKAVIEKVVVE